MAEMIFKSIIDEYKINNIIVDSCATSSEEVGNSIYPLAYDKLVEKGIKVTEHTARKMVIDDYNKYDLIICMDNENISSVLRIIGNDPDNKVHLLTEYTDYVKEIADPWYTRDFETAYNDIYNGCISMYERVIK